MKILAIDPGSEKTGLAILDENAQLLEKEIVPTSELERIWTPLFTRYDIGDIALGNGTGSHAMQRRLQTWLQQQSATAAIHLVDEKYTTEMGRIRYWKCTPRRGWRAWIPTTWQTPPTPIDDFVAWIIGEKFLGIEQPETLNHQ